MIIKMMKNLSIHTVYLRDLETIEKIFSLSNNRILRMLAHYVARCRTKKLAFILQI